jgi:hypothetical protein
MTCARVGGALRRWPARFGIVLVLGGGLCVAGGPVAAQRRDSALEDFFARGRAAQQSMRTIRADFVETSVSALLAKPIVATGTIVAAVNPIRVVMRYAGGRVMWIDERTLAIQMPGVAALEEIDIAATQKRVQRYFAGASLEDLSSSFALTLTAGTSAEPGTDVLDMRPTRRVIRDGVERIRIWVDRKAQTMTRLLMDFPGGDSKQIDLSAIQINVPVDERTFARPPRRGR